ncbi:hypothetical protein B0T25DRAFT_629742 [Lasiosphaeria hispida]|uniref:Uncharacterized protein n=1 Tax=Lasiosphaeria hispida TaxID=260671 RepID=A0AAJ0HT04_9PEZI|nr:hypothetical protein B0T25DRAFT_629742 [Lasiosphaeria hispida]
MAGRVWPPDDRLEAETERNYDLSESVKQNFKRLQKWCDALEVKLDKAVSDKQILENRLEEKTSELKIFQHHFDRMMGEKESLEKGLEHRLDQVTAELEKFPEEQKKWESDYQRLRTQFAEEQKKWESDYQRLSTQFAEQQNQWDADDQNLHGRFSEQQKKWESDFQKLRAQFTAREEECRVLREANTTWECKYEVVLRERDDHVQRWEDVNKKLSEEYQKNQREIVQKEVIQAEYVIIERQNEAIQAENVILKRQKLALTQGRKPGGRASSVTGEKAQVRFEWVSWKSLQVNAKK